MPPALKDAEPRSSDAYVWALGGELCSSRMRQTGLRYVEETPLGWPWVRTLGITSREVLIHWAEENRPDGLAAAKRAMEVEHATGYRDWYEWRICNWGCKSGCCEFAWLSDDQTAFFMMTPWSAPVAIFQKLTELFPTLIFNCHFVEENMGIDETETYAG